MYTVNKIKTFKGNEGYGYNAVLCCDGKRIADAIDDASGGPLDLRFDDADQERRLRDYVATLPARVCNFADPVTGKPAVVAVSMELFVEDLVNTTRIANKVKRLMRTSVVVIEDGELCQYKVKLTPEALAVMQRGNPKAAILNGLSDYDVLVRIAQMKNA